MHKNSHTYRVYSLLWSNQNAMVSIESVRELTGTLGTTLRQIIGKLRGLGVNIMTITDLNGEKHYMMVVE